MRYKMFKHISSLFIHKEITKQRPIEKEMSTKKYASTKTICFFDKFVRVIPTRSIFRIYKFDIQSTICISIQMQIISDVFEHAFDSLNYMHEYEIVNLYLCLRIAFQNYPIFSISYLF